MTLPENPCGMWRPAPTGFMVTSLSIHAALRTQPVDTIDQDRERKTGPRIQDDRGCGRVKGVFLQGCWAGKAGQAGLGGVSGPSEKPCSGSSKSIQGAWASLVAEKKDSRDLETTLRRDLLRSRNCRVCPEKPKQRTSPVGPASCPEPPWR